MTAAPSPIKVTWSTEAGSKVFVLPTPSRNPSNADNLPLIIQIDRGGARYLRKAGHQHDVAGNDHDKPRSGGKRRVCYAQCPSGWRTENFRIVGEGVLCFCDADRQFLVTPVRELLQLGRSLLAETYFRRSVNL